MMAKLKDGAGLLLAGIVVSASAWAFWRYSGEVGGLVLLAGTLVSLFLENHKLRRQLTELGRPPKWRR